MIVGWDFDGVGYVFGEAAARQAQAEGLGVAKATDAFCKTWNFHDRWGMDRDDFELLCNRGVDSGVIFGPGQGLTRPNFFQSVKAVKEAGHTNIAITHRYQGTPGNAERNTFEWIGDNIIYFDDVIFSADKTCVWTDVFVEDNRDNYDALRRAGTNAFLINRPWNGPYEDSRKRITDVKDYAQAIIKHGERLRPKRALVVL